MVYSHAGRLLEDFAPATAHSVMSYVEYRIATKRSDHGRTRLQDITKGNAPWAITYESKKC
jgi:hypothetical protein